MGGRICSMAVADGLPAAGLVLVSYPLHPPGKPDRLRTEHFGALEVPCLFVVAKDNVIDVPALLDHCRAHLSSYKIPEVTHIVTEIPRTGSGKIMRFKLVEALKGS